MPKLNDLQTILLSTAAQRDSDSLLPVQPSVSSAASRITKAIAALVKLGLAEERETSDASAIRRVDGDLGFGMFITDAGKAAINVGEGEGVPQAVAESDAPTLDAPKPERRSKAAEVIVLLSRPDGATLAELIAATGWLPHTTRAALTGIRKKGHVVERDKRGDETCYRIVTGA